MSNTQKSKLTNFFTVLAMVLFIGQTGLATAPAQNTHAIKILSAVFMFLVSATTIWKQRLSQEISNAALWPSVFMGIVATLGLLNDMIDAINIPESIGIWIRWGITFVTTALNGVSKILWPTDQTTSKI